MFVSDDPNRPTRHARVPLDEVQGTDDVSRRLRRLSFRRLKPAGTRCLSGRRCGGSPWWGRNHECPSDGVRTQSAERMVSAVDSHTNRSADSRLRALVACRLRTAVINGNGGRDHECPSDGVRTKFGRSLRNGWCQPSTPTRTVPQTRVCGHSWFERSRLRPLPLAGPKSWVPACFSMRNR